MQHDLVKKTFLLAHTSYRAKVAVTRRVMGV